jgi:hypothetical protein
LLVSTDLPGNSPSTSSIHFSNTCAKFKYVGVIQKVEREEVSERASEVDLKRAKEREHV